MPEKTLTEVFTDIADAIREKTGGAEPIAALDMATAISEIPTGGSGPDLYANFPPFYSLMHAASGGPFGFDYELDEVNHRIYVTDITPEYYNISSPTVLAATNNSIFIASTYKINGVTYETWFRTSSNLYLTTSLIIEHYRAEEGTMWSNEGQKSLYILAADDNAAAVNIDCRDHPTDFAWNDIVIPSNLRCNLSKYSADTKYLSIKTFWVLPVGTSKWLCHNYYLAWIARLHIDAIEYYGVTEDTTINVQDFILDSLDYDDLHDSSNWNLPYQGKLTSNITCYYNINSAVDPEEYEPVSDYDLQDIAAHVYSGFSATSPDISVYCTVNGTNGLSAQSSAGQGGGGS